MILSNKVQNFNILIFPKLILNLIFSLNINGIAFLITEQNDKKNKLKRIARESSKTKNSGWLSLPAIQNLYNNLVIIVLVMEAEQEDRWNRSKIPKTDTPTSQNLV